MKTLGFDSGQNIPEQLSEFIKVGFHLLGGSPVPIPTFSLLPLLFLLFLILKNFSNGATAFSSSSRRANNLPSTWGYHLTPLFSSSRTSFLLYFLHMGHQV